MGGWVGRWVGVGGGGGVGERVGAGVGGRCGWAVWVSDRYRKASGRGREQRGRTKKW
jgi:hypothetical protein